MSRGAPGISELEDLPYNTLKPKRRSNSTSAAAGHSNFSKTKFEMLDEDAMVEYDEDLHGPELEKMSSSSSADTEEGESKQ